MRCAALALFVLVSQTLSVPLYNEKPMVLFSCPTDTECYASPRNCVDDCNAAFSMRSENGGTTFNITMLSGLGYVALLIKDQGPGKYDKAIICSFHQPRGIVARVDYPDPIIVHQFIETSEPEGNTDSLHTQCSTRAAVPMPAKAQFKLISGKWESELVLDERKAVEVVPAVAGARILSTNEKLVFPPSKKMPSVRASPSGEVDIEKTSESFVQRKQFEKKGMKKRIDEDEQDDDDDIDSPEEEVTGRRAKLTTASTTTKGSKKSLKTKVKDMKEKEKQKDQDDSKKEEDEDEDQANTKKNRKVGNKVKDEDRSRFREYDGEDEDNQEEDDPDSASNISVLIGVTVSFAFLYIL